MVLSKKQNIYIAVKVTILILIYFLYNFGLARDLALLRNFSAFLFLLFTFVFMFFNLQKTTHKNKILYYVLLLMVGVWLARNLFSVLNLNRKIVCVFGIYSFINLTFSFLATAYIFYKSASKIRKLQLFIDVVLILIVLVTLGISANYYSIWFSTVSFSYTLLRFFYYFFELMIVVFIFVLFTSYRSEKLAKHNLLILLTLLFLVLLRGISQYGMESLNSNFVELGEYLYLIPALNFWIVTEMLRYGNSDSLFQVESKNQLGMNKGKVYVALFLAFLAIVLFSRNLISPSSMLIIVLTLLLYFMINNAFKQHYLAKERQRDEALIRKQLEKEINRRTKELKSRNEELRQKNELLGELIYFDMSLGLYSIRYLQENIVKWNEDHALLLMVIDIKDFKTINSSFSYAVGDKILLEVATQLKETYMEEAVIFRLNSNKFGLLFLHEISYQRMMEIIHNIHQMGKDGYQIGEARIRFNISIGVAFYEQNAREVQKILENAEYAEREAHKMITENAYQIFDREIEQKVEREKNIRRLLENIDFDEEFELHYQPQCDVNGNLLGMEALLRWKSPELGRVSPGEFIPIAEGSAVILRIAQWTLRKGIEQVKIWNNKYQENYQIGINISTKFIENSSFLKYVQDTIREFDIPPEWLDLEITETSLMNMRGDVIHLFEQLSELGVSISIDDFGTGYSSLSYINAFQMSNIKVARELVDGIVGNPKESALVKAIIMMANSLNVGVVAEGVEDKSQLDLLAELGCEKIQGYYFGKPIDGKNFEENFIKKIKKVVAF